MEKELQLSSEGQLFFCLVFNNKRARLLWLACVYAPINIMPLGGGGGGGEAGQSRGI